jgi:hypothetical protein
MDEQRGQARGSVARRGVLAGVAALVAGVLSRASERVALAAGNGTALTMGNNDDATNAPTNETRLVCGAGGSGSAALFVLNNSGNRASAILGTSGTYQGSVGFAPTGFAGAGVQGVTLGNIGAGVRGVGAVTASLANEPARAGLAGYAQQDASGVGAYGEGRGYGVQGVASSLLGSTGNGTGVLGQSNSGAGVQGSSNGNVGVLGTSSASHGLYGASTNGYGLYATSTNSTGIVASTNGGNAIQGASNGNVGVLGTSNSSIGGFFSSGTSTGLYATGPGAGFAARFDGPVQVNGSFTVLGGPKSAAVPHPDGSHRRLYCVESPESWFEDFGSDQLVTGRARVRLDRDFAALVHGDNYQVFPVPEGDCKGLYITNKTPGGFEVREVQGGTSTLTFGYRVIAKRKDIASPRLERVELPAAPQRLAAPPAPPAIPPVPPLVDPNAPPRLVSGLGAGRDR